MSQPSTPLFQRYGDLAPDLDLPAGADVLQHILEHRSVRNYRPDPLPEGALETIIAAAQSASTSSNLQVWSVVAVRDQARRDRLAELAGKQAHVRAAPLFLVWLADHARLRQIGAEQVKPVDGLDYLEMLLVGVIDAALAAQNAVLALESMGLASVYIGGIRNQPELVAAELGLPKGAFAVFGLCVGYEDQDHPAQVKPRLPQQAVLHHEQYSLAPQPQAVAGYDRVMSEFYAEQGMAQSDWSSTVMARVRSARALNGRDRMTEALRNLGFPLR